MLAPRKIKYRKIQKGRRRGMASTGDYVAFGTYGLKAMEAGWITSRQIESARITIIRKIRKTPNRPVDRINSMAIMAVSGLVFDTHTKNIQHLDFEFQEICCGTIDNTDCQ